MEDKKTTALIVQISEWIAQRNLAKGATPDTQVIKLGEEYGELCSGIARNDNDKVIDSIGDCAVVAIVLAEQYGCVNSLIFTPSKVASKVPVMSEVVEWLGRINYAVARERDEVPEYLGRFTQALSDLAVVRGSTIQEAMQRAYDEIKDRRGLMIDGYYVKEQDFKNKLYEIDQRIELAMGNDEPEFVIHQLRESAMLIQEQLVKLGSN